MNIQQSGNSVAGLKEFLASEYAKGTPVTVYYPLAKPTTEKIIVPLGLTGTVIGNMTQDGTPTPEAPVEVVGVDKYDYGYEIPVVSRGKNLWSKEKAEEGYINKYGYLEKISFSPWQSSYHIPIIAGKIYTFNPNSSAGIDGYHWFYDRDKNPILGFQSGLQTMTAPQNARYIRVCWRVTDSSNVQLELGSEATEYEPYRDPITTPIYLPEPLYKDDYISKDKSGRKVHRAWGVKVFDGTENFILKNNADPLSYLYYIHEDTVPGDTKCTHLSDNGTIPINDIGIYNHSLRQVIYFNFGEDVMNAQPSGNTVDGFKEFLASEYAKGTPVTVYYPLATPTEESIELPEIPTFKGTTTIETSTEIQPENIEITYKSRR